MPLLEGSKTHGTIVAEETAGDPTFREEWESTALARVVAAQLIEYRADHGLSQRKLAERIGFKQPYIARLEAGEHNPTIETLIKISRALGIEFMIDIAPATATRKLVKKSVVEEQAGANARTVVAAASRQRRRRRAA